MDFNAILRWLNVLILGGTVVAFAEVGANDFLNGWTVALAAVLAAQTYLALLVERRRRDPFVIVLAFIIIFYYSLRILTLILVPVSYDLIHFQDRPADSNFALVFIIAANAFLYAGLFAAGGRSSLSIDVGAWRARAPLRGLLLAAGSIVMVYSRGRLWNAESLPRLLQPLLVFLSQGFILLMALTYYAVFRHTMHRRVRVGLLTLIVLEMLLHTLAGSRSALVNFLQNVMLVCLACGGRIRVRRKTLIAAAFLIPALVVVLVTSFLVATYNQLRQRTGQTSFSLSDSLDFVRDFRDIADQDYVTQVGLPEVLMRAGFFDYAADRIANREQYATVVNVPAYLRSVVDNLLTPGFDLFDQPKISNSLIFVYWAQGRPSKITTDAAYSSDQLCLYGELYILFGYASLPLFFVIAFALKRTYLVLRADQPFRLAIMRVVVLTVFELVINSFGLDWVLMDLFQMVVATTVYGYFFAERVSGNPLAKGGARRHSALAAAAASAR